MKKMIDLGVVEDRFVLRPAPLDHHGVDARQPFRHFCEQKAAGVELVIAGPVAGVAGNEHDLGRVGRAARLRPADRSPASPSGSASSWTTPRGGKACTNAEANDSPLWCICGRKTRGLAVETPARPRTPVEPQAFRIRVAGVQVLLDPGPERVRSRSAGVSRTRPQPPRAFPQVRSARSDRALQ